MKNWKLILKQLRYWQKNDEAWQEVMNEFCKTIAPNEYAPIVSPRCVEIFIEGGLTTITLYHNTLFTKTNK